MKESPQYHWRSALAWVMYDFANTAFALVVLALVWPQMFHHYWGANLSPQFESIAFKLTQAVPCLLIFFTAPFLGQLAMKGKFRRRALRVSVVLGGLCTVGLGWVPEGHWLFSAILYSLSGIAFFTASTFYDSMIVDYAPAEKRHQLSGMAFASGFVAGVIILIGLALGLFSGPALHWIYPAAGAWWILFSLPLLSAPDHREPDTEPFSLSVAWQGTVETARKLWAEPRVRWFLLAYILYIDGVHAVKTSAAHFGAVLGFSSGDLIKAFLVVQVIGIPAALAFGWLAHRVGAVRMIAFALVAYVFITVFGSQISPGMLTFIGFSFPSVWLIAAGVGLIQGGVQALSRSYFAELVPAGEEVVYFGFYSMMGKFAAFLGPVLGAVAGVFFVSSSDNTAAERAGFASFALLFIFGLYFLLKAD
ncbi:MAG: MFS transporter, partial [bacterium]